jgi:hypothetical protein
MMEGQGPKAPQTDVLSRLAAACGTPPVTQNHLEIMDFGRPVDSTPPPGATPRAQSSSPGAKDYL